MAAHGRLRNRPDRRGWRSDLVVTDVRMPRVDGVTLVRSLNRREHPLPSIIFVSGFGDVNAREMYGLGVEAFLAKPFRRDELLSAIRTALAERAELWLEPMPAPPRQTMSVDFCAHDGSDEAGILRLGRGGFSARHHDPLSISKVSFLCLTADSERKLCGEGLVRWYSRADQMVGVEFVFLDPVCRAWVIEAIAKENPRGFIPARP
jgi:CheY-like chemotaxis protein